MVDRGVERIVQEVRKRTENSSLSTKDALLMAISTTSSTSNQVRFLY